MCQGQWSVVTHEVTSGGWAELRQDIMWSKAGSGNIWSQGQGEGRALSNMLRIFAFYWVPRERKRDVFIIFIYTTNVCTLALHQLLVFFRDNPRGDRINVLRNF